MTEKNYPILVERIKAIVVDSIVIIVFMFITAFIFSQFDNITANSRKIAFIFIFILYDPLFTSIFGGTLGHMMLGIRVKRESNEMKNIIFPLAFIRYIVKAFLGWVSLLTISGSKKRKAIHDYLVGSVVIYAKENESI